MLVCDPDLLGAAHQARAHVVRWFAELSADVEEVTARCPGRAPSLSASACVCGALPLPASAWETTPRPRCPGSLQVVGNTEDIYARVQS